MSLPRSLLQAPEALGREWLVTNGIGGFASGTVSQANTRRYHGWGSPDSRDAIYHQGTVWSWLLGPFVLAHYQVHRNPRHANALLEGIVGHLEDGCLGTVSEILDGDAPHRPRGCFAQAWSVAETLRAWHFLRMERTRKLT